MIFIDTGALIARYLASDNMHKVANKKWAVLAKSKARLVTSNFVLDETFTLLGRWADYHFAAQKAKLIYASSSLEIVRPDESDEIRALSVFEKFADQSVSFTDCVSFVLMKKRHIRKVFSFDRHFELSGFEQV